MPGAGTDDVIVKPELGRVYPRIFIKRCCNRSAIEAREAGRG